MLGDSDNRIGVDAVRPLAAALPRGTFEVLHGAGHVAIDEVPERVLAAVAAVAAAA
jgi:pimeloyl-ACP methyl ester carboxylesterase